MSLYFDRFYTITELVNVRRWKREAITKFLGRPDQTVPGIHKQPAQLFSVSRVLSAELLYPEYKRAWRKRKNAHLPRLVQWIG
jgi:hypothetical protein